MCSERTRVDMAEGVGFEPTRERKPPGGFQDRCLKPLGHPSLLIRQWLSKTPLLPKPKIGTQLAPRTQLSVLILPPSAPLP
jgi:hypothetical protein